MAMTESFSSKMNDVLKDWSPYAKDYDPLSVGSIDGTDTEPHDKAVNRAIQTHYEPPCGLTSSPSRSLFVARFSPKLTKEDLVKHFSRCGNVLSVKLIVDIVTGHSQGYGFVEMGSEDEARKAVKILNETVLKGSKIFVDVEFARTMKGWKPRRLGGGFGGKKESGQLRFGGKDRPFKKPITFNMMRRN